MEVRLFKQCDLLPITLKFDPYLFLTSEHWLTQTSSDIYYFCLYRPNENSAAAIFECVPDNNQNWLSPVRAPFGGIQCDDSCTSNEIALFLNCIDQWVTSCRGNKIVIKVPPSCYNLDINRLVSDCFLKNNYTETSVYVNHHIPVGPGSYEKLIHTSERRRLRKSKMAGFICSIYKSPTVEIVYGFLQNCRVEKGYGLSMTFCQLQELFVTFPEEILVFTVKDQEQIIALNVTVRINQSILYHFLSSSLPTYAQYSPAVILTEEIYIFCQSKGISILDLGISLDHFGNEKPGLIRFKENIGGKKSYKSIYEKVLN